MIYLDTHVVAWLYDGDLKRFSAKSRRLLESNPLSVSPIVQLELTYLKEINRIVADAALIMESLRQSIGLAICDLPFGTVVVESMQQAWTRDPFDRIIVAQANLQAAMLLTKDTGIRKYYPRAVW